MSAGCILLLTDPAVSLLCPGGGVDAVAPVADVSAELEFSSVAGAGNSLLFSPSSASSGFLSSWNTTYNTVVIIKIWDHLLSLIKLRLHVGTFRQGQSLNTHSAEFNFPRFGACFFFLFE